MSFTDQEEQAIQAAVPAYVTASARLADPNPQGGGDGKFKGITADEILTSHGIVHGRSFTGDYRKYGQVEAEIRRRASLAPRKARSRPTLVGTHPARSRGS